MLLPSDTRGLGRCRREENVLLTPPRRHVQDCMTRPSEQCGAASTYQEGREREWEGDRWKTGSLEPEEGRIHLLLTARSVDLGRWNFEVGWDTAMTGLVSVANSGPVHMATFFVKTVKFVFGHSK